MVMLYVDGSVRRSFVVGNIHVEVYLRVNKT